MSHDTKRLRMRDTESGRHPAFPGFATGQYHCLAGHEYDVPAGLADAWIAQGVAEPVAPKRRSTKKTQDTEPQDEPQPEE